MGSSVGIILAAGKGTRMLDPQKPKVLFPLQGKPLIGWVIESLLPLQLDRIIAVVGYQREQLIAFLAAQYPTIDIAIQEEQLGTGHAVLQALPMLDLQSTTVLIVNGDVPLVRAQTLKEFLAAHYLSDAVLSILTTCIPAPQGYGRILRNDDGSVRGIVEEADLDGKCRAINEVNTGIYAADAATLKAALYDATPQNAQGEYYLTDAVSILVARGARVDAWLHPEWQQFVGVNTPEQLEEAERLLMQHQQAPTPMESKAL